MLGRGQGDPQHKLNSNPTTWARSSRERGPGLCLPTAAAGRPALRLLMAFFVCLGSWRCQSWGAPGCLPMLHGTGEGPGATWHQPSQVSPRTCHLCRAAHLYPEHGSFPDPGVGYPMGVTFGVQGACLVVTRHGHMSIPVTLPLPFSLWVPLVTGWVSGRVGAGAEGSGCAARGQQRRRTDKAKVWEHLHRGMVLALAFLGGPAGEMRMGCKASLGSPRSGAVLHPHWAPPSEHPHHMMGEGERPRMELGSLEEGTVPPWCLALRGTFRQELHSSPWLRSIADFTTTELAGRSRSPNPELHQHREVTASAPVRGGGALPGPEMTDIVTILKPL